MNPKYVRDWMSVPAIVVDPDSSVSHALTLMRRRGIHSLVVGITGDNPHYGIVTTTDILDKIVAADADPAGARVRDIMTSPVICADPGWTLRQCSITMQQGKFHHLPVADEHGTIVGMISDKDIFMAAEEIGWAGQ
jgi:signal-transduction protein with cAMP-binding, CBS, and nucleotidyltransferase domain